MSKTHWGHTLTPAFSVDNELLWYFPGHVDAFQILYGVYQVLSWSSRLSLCTAYIPVYSLSWQSVVVHSQNVPEPSQSSLFYDEIYLLQLCLRPDPLATDCLSIRYPSFLFGTCDVRLLASSFVRLSVATILHRITSWTSLTTRTISL